MPKKALTLAFKEATLSCGITVNMGNFNSARFDLGFTVRVDENQALESVYSDMRDLLAEQLKATQAITVACDDPQR